MLQLCAVTSPWVVFGQGVSLGMETPFSPLIPVSIAGLWQQQLSLCTFPTVQARLWVMMLLKKCHCSIKCIMCHVLHDWLSFPCLIRYIRKIPPLLVQRWTWGFAQGWLRDRKQFAVRCSLNHEAFSWIQCNTRRPHLLRYTQNLINKDGHPLK